MKAIFRKARRRERQRKREMRRQTQKDAGETKRWGDRQRKIPEKRRHGEADTERWSDKETERETEGDIGRDWSRRKRTDKAGETRRQTERLRNRGREMRECYERDR